MSHFSATSQNCLHPFKQIRSALHSRKCNSFFFLLFLVLYLQVDWKWRLTVNISMEFVLISGYLFRKMSAIPLNMNSFCHKTPYYLLPFHFFFFIQFSLIKTHYAISVVKCTDYYSYTCINTWVYIYCI